MDSVAHREPARPASGRWLRPGWPLYIALTVLLGFYQGLNQIIGMRAMQVMPWKPFLWEISSVVVIVALIPLIVRVEQRFRLDARPRDRIIAAHIATALVFSIVHTAGMIWIRKFVYALVGDTYHVDDVLITWFYELQKDAITYLIILLGVFAVREFKVRRAGELRARALAADLSDARLRHLTAQIDPHFLFNALNAISNRMREDVDAADRMITRLGDLLRAAYDTDDQVIVPLSRELEWLRGYTAMMSERYRGQLAFQLDVEPGLEGVSVPRLLLQPIVENAFRHGLAEGRGNLWVSIRREGDFIRCEIADDGVGLSGAAEARGTGLSNVARRLELLFPGRHELKLVPRDPRGTLVTVRFPVTP